MYSTCLFCSRALGANEVLETFPVGRRIAYDAAKGRLWVVCRSCERWNLSPLEERWEAIESCERLYSATRLRVSTENIGLARLKEGLELVRIGEPMRPEFAAWRYGDQFGRRRRRTMVRVGAGLGALGLAAAGAWTAGVGFIGMWWGGQGLFRRVVHGDPSAVVAQVRTADGQLLHIQRRHAELVRLLGRDDGSWQLVLSDSRRRHVARGSGRIVLEGEDARRTAGSILAAINRYGGTKQQVRHAVLLLEQQRDPERFLAQLGQRVGFRDPLPLAAMTPHTRLAVEMAVHEETERRALEGELHELERAWREAEEIAGISDQLLLPDRLQETVDRLKRRDD